MKPAYALSVGGLPVTSAFSSLLLEMEVTDQEGSNSDSIRIRLDDRNGLLAIPRKGQIIAAAMGYRESGLAPMGLFTIESVSLKGWPQEMEISGKSMDFTKMLKEQRTSGYEKKNLGQICGEIAGRHGLANGCSGTIAKLKYDYIGQTEESDAHFLQTIADEHDGVFAVKDGRLVLKKKGENILGVAIVTRPGNIIDYTFSENGRSEHKGGEADWWDRKQAKRMRSKGSAGGKGMATNRAGRLHTNGKQEADDAAQSRASALKRAEKSLSMTVVGSPRIRAEMILIVVGVRGSVDGAYRIKSAVHTLGPDGYQTKIEAEGIA